MFLEARVGLKAHLITALPHGAGADAVDVVPGLLAVLGDQLGELNGESPLRLPLEKLFIDSVKVDLGAIGLEESC